MLSSSSPLTIKQLLRAYDVNCPKYEKLREEDTHSAGYMRVEQQNKGFFRKLERLSGYETVNLSNVGHLRDAIFIENGTGLPLAGWDLPSDLDRMIKLSDYVLTLRFNSTEKHRLTAGNWLQKVLSDMMGKATGNQTLADKKVFLYSAHDTTVACMMSALGVFNGLHPPYTSAFFVELYSDDSGNYSVQLLFHNKTDSNEAPMVLNVSSCNNPSQCSLQEFQWLVEPLIPSNWEEECGWPDSGDNAGVVVALAVLFAVSGTILIICSVVLCFTCYRHRCRKPKYTIVPDSEPSL